MAEVPAEVSRYMSEMGIKGGRIGGLSTGPRKKRPAAHYKKMVAARNAQRLQKAREASAPHDPRSLAPVKAWPEVE